MSMTTTKAQTAGRAPDLEPHCGSWIVASNISGRAYCETYLRDTADRYAGDPSFSVYTAVQWLARINRAATEARHG